MTRANDPMSATPERREYEENVPDKPTKNCLHCHNTRWKVIVGDGCAVQDRTIPCPHCAPQPVSGDAPKVEGCTCNPKPLNGQQWTECPEAKVEEIAQVDNNGPSLPNSARDFWPIWCQRNNETHHTIDDWPIRFAEDYASLRLYFPPASQKIIGLARDFLISTGQFSPFDPNATYAVTGRQIVHIINQFVAQLRIADRVVATPASTARADGNRYWDIFTADDGGRLVRLCWEKNDAGNFMAMEVAELVTWNNATEQKEAEDFLLMALNAVEKDRNWLLKRAEGEDKTFLAALGIQVLLATVNKEALKQLAIARGTSMAKVVNDWLQELRGQGST